MAVALAICATALVAAVAFILYLDSRRAKDARAYERERERWYAEKHEHLDTEKELRSQLMYALEKPWRMPEVAAQVAEEELEPVYADYGPEMVPDDEPWAV